MISEVLCSGLVFGNKYKSPFSPKSSNNKARRDPETSESDATGVPAAESFISSFKLGCAAHHVQL